MRKPSRRARREFGGLPAFEEALSSARPVFRPACPLLTRPLQSLPPRWGPTPSVGNLLEEHHGDEENIEYRQEKREDRRSAAQGGPEPGPVDRRRGRAPH